MSVITDAQREAEVLVVQMGLDPDRKGNDALTEQVFRTALLSVLEFGDGTVAPSTTDQVANPEA